MSETEHELRKRVELIAQRGHLDVAAATHLADAALAVVASRVVLAQPEGSVSSGPITVVRCEP